MSEIPENIKLLRDLAVEDSKANNQIQGLQTLYEWFETGGWDLIADSWFDEELAIPLNNLIKTEFNDLALHNYDGIEIENITNEKRLDRARDLIEESVEYSPSIHVYRLLQHENDSPVLCCLASLEGYHYKASRWGIFKNSDEFIDDLRESGYILKSDLSLISDEKILSYWSKSI